MDAGNVPQGAAFHPVGGFAGAVRPQGRGAGAPLRGAHRATKTSRPRRTNPRPIFLASGGRRHHLSAVPNPMAARLEPAIRGRTRNAFHGKEFIWNPILRCGANALRRCAAWPKIRHWMPERVALPSTSPARGRRWRRTGSPPIPTAPSAPRRSASSKRHASVSVAAREYSRTKVEIVAPAPHLCSRDWLLRRDNRGGALSRWSATRVRCTER